MASGFQSQKLSTHEHRSNWWIACCAVSGFCLVCLLVIIGILWLGRDRLPVLRNWRTISTPTLTVTPTNKPTQTNTHTLQPTYTDTPRPSETPIPTFTSTATHIPTKSSTATRTETLEPSPIPGESPFLPPGGFPVCTTPRTESFTTGSNFTVLNESYVTGEIVSGEYRMTMKDSNIWAWTTDSIKSDDAVYMVDVEQASAGSGAYGLIFGADSLDNTRIFYAFVIDANTNFAVFRHTSTEEWETVVDWHSSLLLYSGGALNHIVAIRSGPMIALFANDYILTSAVFDDGIQGANYAGLIAWSNDTPGLQAVFDNYSVCSLNEPYPMPVYIGLEDTFRIPADQPVVLHMGWLARTRSQAKSYADNARITLMVDGKEYIGLQEYWEPVLPYAGGYGLEWNLPMALLSPGVHHIEYSLRLLEQVTDGLDLDNNGKLDLYGPGDVYHGWVDINAQR